MDKLQHIIEQERELLERETYSRSAINYSGDMAADERDRYIRYLVDRVNDSDLDKRAMLAVLEDFKEVHAKMQAQLDEVMSTQSTLVAENSDLKTRLKSAETKARKLDEQLKFANKNRFGDKRQNPRKKSDKKDDSDRNDEREKFDGTNGTLSTGSVEENHEVSTQCKSDKRERDLTKRPDSYNTMEVQGEPPRIPCATG